MESTVIYTVMFDGMSTNLIGHYWMMEAIKNPLSLVNYGFNVLH